LTTGTSHNLPSLFGLEVLLRSQDSKIKELVLERMNTNTVGLHPVIRELGRNTTVTKLAIIESALSRENVQQLKSMLRQNTALESLDLTSSTLRSAGLAEIALVLYRNTSIKTLDLTENGLDDIESANVLRELIRRNKTISSLCVARNAFGRNAAAVRSIAEGVRSNRTLQQLDLRCCRLGDRGVSVVANALAIRNASLLELKEIHVLGHRNRFTPLLKASDPPGISSRIGIWSRALAKVATEPEVLFHVLRNKPKLVSSAGGSNKRKRDGE
jgi:hypothetical protein